MISLVRLGRNFNKRWYVGVIYGVLPAGEWEQQKVYPWYKRWRVDIGIRKIFGE